MPVGRTARGSRWRALAEALALAQTLAHPCSLAFAQALTAWVSQFCRNVPAVREHAEATIALATAQGFSFWTAWGTILRGLLEELEG